jgi:hypothetical protein
MASSRSAKQAAAPASIIAAVGTADVTSQDNHFVLTSDPVVPHSLVQRTSPGNERTQVFDRCDQTTESSTRKFLN